MFKRLLLLIGLAGTLLTGTAVSQTVSAAPLPASQVAQINNPSCAPIFLTFPVWYRGLPGGDQCKPQITKISDVWVIALNVTEMLLQAVAYAAVGYIIWGGIRYSISAGDPGKITAAKNTITNAVIGFVIALSSIGIVNFVAGLI
ncbi:MAG TPA: pilin [Verrucomicrobiae bacterium]|nr:pilin [Verrucomicrobiae bacterium]